MTDRAQPIDDASPYRSSPVFDETDLPAALRREHRTKPGVWGVVRAMEGSLDLHFADGTPTRLVTPDRPGIILPDQPHWVVPGDRMRMRVDFYTCPPPMSLNGDESS
ncbi:DUF1971 domain-containing protein [Pacificimonas sp. WHA3]|uniref:DUF1971 domain-containing protein n=1 Tax=Pacificimonas pallii TaxID=2827236 RepID=A0ABS6SHL6_9SPHN|nr:DUF1971 domain-containing protein [Pacificimonas pallii]MBV7257918.1 DUF1971 domain-containing protein [Pacificimonas pallii]